MSSLMNMLVIEMNSAHNHWEWKEQHYIGYNIVLSQTSLSLSGSLAHCVLEKSIQRRLLFKLKLSFLIDVFHN